MKIEITNELFRTVSNDPTNDILRKNKTYVAYVTPSHGPQVPFNS